MSSFALLLSLLLLLLPATPGWAAPEEAILAGGCFWCLEHDLEDLSGVLEVVSGFSGGKLARPSYRQVSAGGTGHQEVVRVRFDNSRLRYETLLRAYWRNIDPFDGSGQFCDRGDSYRPLIFTTQASQAQEARNSAVAAARELGRPLAALKVQIRPAGPFWPAEEYHQDYARRNSLRYRYYRFACGRDRRLDQVWGTNARGRAPWRSARDPAAATALAGSAGPGLPEAGVTEQVDIR